MIKRRHLHIAKKSGANTGNNTMRLFRRLHRFAGRHLKELLDRDLVKDALEGQWFKVSRRQTCLKDHELPAWNKAIQKIGNPIIRDFLQLLIFTGIRENEGLTLRWEDVDMEGKTFTVREEIAKNRKPHSIPMSDVVLDLFKQRLDARENEFVFPGIGRTGHLTETQRQINFVELETRKMLNGAETNEGMDKLIEELPADQIKPGIRFCLHDLRRTFASIAENEVSYSVLKRLMNHSDKDVTQGYIILSIDKLRLPMQQVTNAIRGMLVENKVGKVIPMRGKKDASATE
jgi:integrase